MTNPPLINRRQFIQLVAIASASWPLISHAEKKTLGKDTDLVYKNLSDPWLTLASVQEHLFPADDTSPGAKDIFALRYLQSTLSAPNADKEDVDFIYQGVGWLNDLSTTMHKNKFIKLNSDEKEKVLRKIETSRAGNRWLSSMMTYLIEALLSDPVYGGNKDQKGWKWLEHQPGFPLPTTQQVYFNLVNHSQKNTRRRTKS
ncbi:hypothetical protein MNBD_GAMMA08-2388 [hydrothermal vent metagenome]|uniref:Tat (Twin-arginine translocation) pathway signal sequence domain protein n=1 Tax=hydrothermal vent metagenome TaxID=652676 RepID=A0A3B0YBS9_9ZZZZ